MSPDQSASVWKWRDCATTAKRNEPGPRLRRQAIIQAIVTAVIGLLVDRLLGHHIFALVLWSLAAVVFLLGVISPRAYAPIHRFGAVLGRWVGSALAFILLVPLFYLLFFPVSLWLRISGRDPLHRAARDLKYTCWIRRRPADGEPDYRRQFLVEDRLARGELRPVGDGCSTEGEVEA